VNLGLTRSPPAAVDDRTGADGDLALPAGLRALILGSGKAGHEVNCLGVARALGLDPQIARVRPRRLFALLSPYGPVDPFDPLRKPGSALAAPWPDIVFASGRATVPYFRALKRLSGRSAFCVFLQDPRWSRASADVIWVPEHDRLRGDKVIVTATAPHALRPGVLEQARQSPDPRVGALPPPRLAMILGGPSGAFRFEPSDFAAIAAIARAAAEAGFSVMATPSRRTPPDLVRAVRDGAASAGGPTFVWRGDGPNPYVSILANADSAIVTADSVNMIGEALATRASVHIYEPTGGDAKMKGFIDRLEAKGALRRWSGRFDVWPREPIDATTEIAREVRERFLRFRRLAVDCGTPARI
jgi:uncharacterized protein